MADTRRRRNADSQVLGDTFVGPPAPEPADSDILSAYRANLRRPTQADVVRDGGAIVDTPEGGREVVLEPFSITGDPRTEEEKPGYVTSFVRGLGNTVALGQMPRIMAAVDTAGDVLGDTTIDEAPQRYQQNRQRWERAYRDAAEENPIFSSAGTTAGILGTVLTPAGPLTRLGQAPTMAGRIGRGALIGGTMEAIPAALDAEASPIDRPGQFASEVAMRALPAAGLGAAGAGLAEFARLVTPERAAQMANSIDQRAAPLRTRSAGARTIGFQRLVEDLPGGHEQAARVLDETGIMPRGTLFGTVDDAATRAGAARAQAGSEIGAVREAMEAASLPSLEPIGYRSQSGMSGMVDSEPLAQAYDDIARRYERIPEMSEARNAAIALARETRELGPMTFEEAQQRKQALDSLINWRSPSPGNRLSPLTANRQDVRRSVANAMDSAVASDLGEEALSGYRNARQRYQVAGLFDDFAHDHEMREAANRILSPSDNAAMMAATFGEHGSGWKGLAALLANRFTRGREASISAGVLERTADALRRIERSDPDAVLALAGVRNALARGPLATSEAIQVLARQNPAAANALAAQVTESQVQGSQVQTDYIPGAGTPQGQRTPSEPQQAEQVVRDADGNIIETDYIP